MQDTPTPVQEDPLQVLEVRRGEPGQPVTITVAVSAAASRAMFIALSEQLDRRRREPVESADELLALREDATLVERFEALARADAHAVFRFTDSELRACLLSLTAYVDRVDIESFLPPELRERLAEIARITPVLWDANAASTAVAEAPAPAL